VLGGAHDLKSASGGFGAARLQRVAHELNVACREARGKDAYELLALIGPIAQEAFDALQAKSAQGTAD